MQTGFRFNWGFKVWGFRVEEEIFTEPFKMRCSFVLPGEKYQIQLLEDSAHGASACSSSLRVRKCGGLGVWELWLERLSLGFEGMGST